MNGKISFSRQYVASLIIPIAAAILLSSGCAGSKQTSTPLPTFTRVYTFGNSLSEAQVTVLPDGTAYGISQLQTSSANGVLALIRYSDFGKGTATVIASPVYPPDPSYAVAVSPVNGNIYVTVPPTLPADKPVDTIGVFTPSGQQLLTFTNPAPVPGYRGSDRIVIDSKGFVYILGQNTSGVNFVYKCDPSGNLLKAIDVSAVSLGTDAPMAIDAADRLYFIGAKVSELTTEGTIVKQFPVNVGQHINGLGVDGAGNVYLSNSTQYGEPYGMFRFSPDGVLTAEGGSGPPFTVDTNGTVYFGLSVIQVEHVTS